MTFQLTIETLLVFGAPGLLALAAAMIANNTVEAKVSSFFATPNAALGIAILVIIFLLGALVDTVRAALLDPFLDLWFSYRDKKRQKAWIGFDKKPPGIVEFRGDYLSWLTDKNLPVFSFIMERTHAYYRLSARTLAPLLGRRPSRSAFSSRCMYAKTRTSNSAPFLTVLIVVGVKAASTCRLVTSPTGHGWGATVIPTTVASMLEAFHVDELKSAHLVEGW